MSRLTEILVSSITQDEARDKYVTTAARYAVRALLWSETDDNGEPFDSNYHGTSVHQDDVTKLRQMIRAFINSDYDDDPFPVWAAIKRQSIEPSQFGHDFILTANRHGAGFWDRGYGEDGEFLTEMSKAYGNINLYVGDDEKLYITGV